MSFIITWKGLFINHKIMNEIAHFHYRNKAGHRTAVLKKRSILPRGCVTYGHLVIYWSETRRVDVCVYPSVFIQDKIPAKKKLGFIPHPLVSTSAGEGEGALRISWSLCGRGGETGEQFLKSYIEPNLPPTYRQHLKYYLRHSVESS